MSKQDKQLKITLVKSTIGAIPGHKLCVKGLGLKRIGHSVIRDNTPSTLGLVRKVTHLLKVEEI